MRSGISALCFVAVMGCAAAEAPAPAPTTAPTPAAVGAPAATTGTRFDGTYAFVSSTKLNETYFNRASTHVRPCSDQPMSALMIVNGSARFHGFGRWTTAGFEGTVGPQGELTMRLAPQAPLAEVNVLGRIDGNGTVSARQIGAYCRYDLI